MGDAFSHIGRDQERRARYDHYLDALLAYLKHQTPENQTAVLEAAEETDSLKGMGYFSSPTSIQPNLQEVLEGLVAGDTEVWSRFLSGLMSREHPRFDEFKAVSPMAGQILLKVDCCHGFYSLGTADLKQTVIRHLEGQGYSTEYGNGFLIALPSIDADQPVTLLRSPH
ncbi:MAG: hypothetical protein BWY68_00469 [bacterium ADurb.Bin400]|nr:MAG: hypothetical protein BWY68_00469 [bacterium ADurb.Bin400]